MPKPTKGPRLGGGPAHERLLLANLAAALYTHERITTTETKATSIQRRRVATETDASVAGPEASAETEVHAAVTAATGTGQRRLKKDSRSAAAPREASTRNSAPPCRSATVSQTAPLITSTSAVRRVCPHGVSRGW